MAADGPIHLILYVAGEAELSRAARKNLNLIIKRFPRDQTTFECVDVMANPRLARQNRVAATPMLVRQLPQPMYKVLGDLNDHDRVINSLDLTDYQIIQR